MSAAVRGDVGGRPVVALGGGRVVDSAKAIGAADELPVAAMTTTLSGAELTGFHRLPEGVEGKRLVRPSLVIARPGADGVGADAATRGERPECTRARGRGDVHTAHEPGRNDGGIAARRPHRRVRARRGRRPRIARPGRTARRVRERADRLRGPPCGLPDDRACGRHPARGHQRDDAPAQHPADAFAGAGGDRAGGGGARRAGGGGPPCRARGGERLACARLRPRARGDVVAAVLPRAELQNTPSPPDEAELREFVEAAL